jgi:polyisoprenyl-teichoic acid--peptidoglycan teichoic acid transferase
LKRFRRAEQPPYRLYKTHASRRRRWIFISLGVVAFLIVAAGGVLGGSYLWFAEKVSSANQRTPEPVQQALAEKPSTTLVSIAQSPEAMNIILLGSDNRSKTSDEGSRSDTIMVLHVDPKLDFATLLSIPRDLYVSIAGHGKNRINAAYAYGGAELTIKTVKNLLGLDINKYVEVGFGAFEKIVDSLGGVYLDIDRLYDTESPRPTHLQPGYRLVSGSDALLFARYRFDQNVDFGRMIRQQRVLAAVREQAMGWSLPLKVPSLAGTILDETATNLSANELINLAYWLVKLDGNHIKQIVITADSKRIDSMVVLVPDKDTIKAAVTKLLTAPGSESTATTESGETTTTSSDSGGATLTTTASEPETTTSTSTESTSTTETAQGTTKVANAAMWKAAQEEAGFTLEAPSYLPPNLDYAYKMPETGGTYQIDPKGKSKPAVRMMYRYKSADLYVGITATTWTDAPVASKGVEVEQDGIKYTVVGTSGKVDHIWWKKDKVLYWISNTLMYTVNEKELLKMAASMAPVESGS